jgi:cystathionine gamma-lyase
VKRVIYPSLESHPQHVLAKRQMQTGGAMVTVIWMAACPARVDSSSDVHLFTLAESLGGVESLIEHPGLMTHASIPPARRAELGLMMGWCDLSVGIEDVRDLKHALE